MESSMPDERSRVTVGFLWVAVVLFVAAGVTAGLAGRLGLAGWAFVEAAIALTLTRALELFGVWATSTETTARAQQRMHEVAQAQMEEAVADGRVRVSVGPTTSGRSHTRRH